MSANEIVDADDLYNEDISLNSFNNGLLDKSDMADFQSPDGERKRFIDTYASEKVEQSITRELNAVNAKL